MESTEPKIARLKQSRETAVEQNDFSAALSVSLQRSGLPEEQVKSIMKDSAAIEDYFNKVNAGESVPKTPDNYSKGLLEVLSNGDVRKTMENFVKKAS